jgi:hypothetical protein
MQKSTIKQIEFMASDLNAQELTTRGKSGKSITFDRIELMPNMPAPPVFRNAAP